MTKNWRRAAVCLQLAAVLAAAAGCRQEESLFKGGSGSGSGHEQSLSAGSKAELNQAAFTVLAEKLRVPWGIQFHGDTIYISEREGNIVAVQDMQMTRLPVKLSKAVFAQGEGGFLGLVLAPDFASSGQAYAYHTYRENGNVLNRVVLLKKQGDSWSEAGALLEDIPGSVTHNGGRLAIGPDRQLYITTGDAGKEQLAQDLSSTAGKILRMTLDGQIPADNPFPNSLVYSYGHRNPQGLAWNSKGALYSSEHGPSGTPGGHDEMNRIEPGKNYGWPVIIGDQEHPDMVKPLYHSGETAIAPSGITFAGDSKLLVSALRGQRLFMLDTDTHKLTAVLEKGGRLRDVQIHEGRTYVITNNTDGRGTPSEQDDRLLLLK
ncbi:PQQ-dependent sugar dehydrogenase [Paenibacillus sp. y28]|uniref:PQQ-dependent sugar dehydrogenase n=1 Tax=Paenibacillus sp. y28 TaxID=3129110 RepID=UPI003015B617